MAACEARLQRMKRGGRAEPRVYLALVALSPETSWTCSIRVPIQVDATIVGKKSPLAMCCLGV
jgi:hypothetical protein